MIRFVPSAAVLVLHADLIREFGGQPGIRDRGLLNSAVDRAVNLHNYEDADLFALAAAYAIGITKNHPFIDGNKRTGFLTAYSFLLMNKIDLTAPEEEVVILMMGVADGSVDEITLASWFRSYSNSAKV